jgi:RNA polymerase sigma factor (sigma-70 family)
MRFTETVEKLETKLRKIAGNVTNNKADQDDLLQEGWIYLWKNREKLENKTVSYVLTGCYFRFIDYLKQGSSIDSKSRKNITVISLYYINDEGQTPLVSRIPSRVEDAKNTLTAKDLEEQIRNHLNTKLKETYDLLLEGYTLGEIAKRLNLTHEAVRLQVKKIRRTARDYLTENLDF